MARKRIGRSGCDAGVKWSSAVQRARRQRDELRDQETSGSAEVAVSRKGVSCAETRYPLQASQTSQAEMISHSGFEPEASGKVRVAFFVAVAAR